MNTYFIKVYITTFVLYNLEIYNKRMHTYFIKVYITTFVCVI